MKKTILILLFLNSLLFSNEVANETNIKLNEKISQAITKELKVKSKSKFFNNQFVVKIEKYKELIPSKKYIYKIILANNVWHHGMKEYEEIRKPHFLLIDDIKISKNSLEYKIYLIENMQDFLDDKNIDVNKLKLKQIQNKKLNNL